MATRRAPAAVSTNGHARFATPARGLMKERAYEEIKKRLLNNDYPPGSFLAERQLAELLGMSKTPVKAALERLELEGFITVSPQQGIVVRELAVQEIADQYEIRVALETYTLRAVAGKLTPEQESRLRANLAAQVKVRGKRDVSGAVELDAAFHTLFPEFLGNGEILRTMTQLRDKMRRVITTVFQMNPARIDSSVDEHLAIAETVFAGHGPRAAKLIEDHLGFGKKLILTPRRG